MKRIQSFPAAILIIAYILLSSGAEKSETSLKEIRISTKNVTDTLPYLSYSVQKLDNRIEAYFKYASKFIFTESHMFFKNLTDHSVIVFDSDGKYLSSVSKRGRGPGEYTFLTDFIVDINKKEVIVADNQYLKKFKFNGDFISQISLESRFSRITRLENGNYLVEKDLPTDNVKQNYRLTLLNNQFKPIDYRMPIQISGQMGFGINGQLYRALPNKDYTYFLSYFGDTVYHISDAGIDPAFALKFDKNVITTNDGNPGNSSQEKNAYTQLTYYEKGDYSLLFFWQLQKRFCFVFNNKTGNSKCFNNVLGYNNFHEDQLITIVNSFDLINYIKYFDPGLLRCSNRSDLQEMIKNPMDDFQVIIRTNLDLSGI